MNDSPIPREARPTDSMQALDAAIPSGMAEPVAPLLPPPPEPIVEPEHAGTPKTMAAMESTAPQPIEDPPQSSVVTLPSAESPLLGSDDMRPTVESLPIDASAYDALAVDASAGEIEAAASTTSDDKIVDDKPSVEATGDNLAVAASDDKPSVEATDDKPAVAASDDTPTDDALAIPQQTADERHSDQIAEQRGLPPIAEPYVREVAPPHPPVPRSWLFASLGVSVACVFVTLGVVLWARGEVRAARAAQATALPAMKTVAPVAASVEPAVEAQPPEVTASAPASAASCALEVSASVSGATVFVDGMARGKAPVEFPITCGRDVTVEVRHPRYEDFKRTLVADDGTVEVVAQLEREKTELTVWSEPAGATVTYNGRVLGTTPLVTKVNRYEQGTLWFRKPGMAADWRRIMPKQPAKTVSIALKPAS